MPEYTMEVGGVEVSAYDLERAVNDALDGECAEETVGFGGLLTVVGDINRDDWIHVYKHDEGMIWSGSAHSLLDQIDEATRPEPIEEIQEVGDDLFGSAYAQAVTTDGEAGDHNYALVVNSSVFEHQSHNMQTKDLAPLDDAHNGVRYMVATHPEDRDFAETYPDNAEHVEGTAFIFFY